MITLVEKMPIPAGHRVLVELQKIEEKTKSGIFIPDVARENEQMACQVAKVTGLGYNAWKSFDDGKTWVMLDEDVLISSYAGFEAKTVDREGNDKHFWRIINDEDLICYVKPEQEAREIIQQIARDREEWSKQRPTGWKV